MGQRDFPGIVSESIFIVGVDVALLLLQWWKTMLY
jgi:hypothetical protein